MTRAVVFAYHDVGVRCLSVLLAHGVDIPLVVTHEDDAREATWFASVAAFAAERGIPAIMPADANGAGVIERVRGARPDLLFSFYYRSMLGPQLLRAARRGAFNMHGSRLPHYRGRAPVNWAVLHGERETGATLHEMVEKPDAGGIVGQQAVPILPNDLAIDVMRKVTVAAEMVLDRALPALVEGKAQAVPQDLSKGSYFGRRRPGDGRIDWSRDAWSVHNLVRAVAPPYPGAFAVVGSRRLGVSRTLFTGESVAEKGAPALFVDQARLCLRCADGGILKVLDADLDGARLDAENFQNCAGTRVLTLKD